MTLGRTAPIETAAHRPWTRLDDEQNLLLSALPKEDLDRLRPRLEQVSLPLGMTIYEANAPITHVYFVRAGIVSMVSTMREGTVEVGTVGCEGMTGIAIVLHADSMPTRAFVQVAGEAVRISAGQLHAAMRESRALERVLSRYALALFDQAAQSAACNRLHTLEERCARWLLMTHDRVRDDVLPLKQTFLAEMLGVHRPAVTVAAGTLQRAGIISYTRGKVRIVDRTALEAAACDCYAITR
ncbi:MAG TPA: Crp/Fnr family transcriptional regulator, partial [Gemmatimonadaceae bacterium]|nr:Crp/Fnr family transcriptional regulator [Gemmatimonadaceae bacterium]